MHKKFLWMGIAVVVLVPIGAVAWWLLSPLLTDTVVEEELSFASGAVVPPGMTRVEVEQVMAGMAKIDQPVDEDMPPALTANEPGAVVATSGSSVVLKQGGFRDADRFHKGAGRATIYRGPDGAHLLRLEDFNVTNGTDLHVILSPDPDPQDREGVHAGGYVDLGSLKGNVGNQNYPVPDDVNVGTLGSVVIYCAPFQVIFSVAPLRESG